MAATACIFAADSSMKVKSVVRTDARSGRLVRTIQVRELPPTRTATAKPEVKLLIAKTAQKHDVDVALVDSIVQVESNYSTSAVSNKGAMGLMQLIPATAKRFGVQDPFDAQQNLEGGIKYLKYLQQLYGDNRLALAAYNAGEGAVAKFGSIPPYAETQNYVVEVNRRYGKALRERAIAEPVAQTPAPERRIEQFTDAEGRIHFRMQ